ncbi:unnamed protein product [Sphagnum balticum]
MDLWHPKDPIDHSFDLFFREYIGSSSLQKAREHAGIRFYGSQEAGNPRPLQECKQGFVEEFRVSCCEGQPCGAFSTLLLQALLFSSCAAAAVLTPSVLCIFVFVQSSLTRASKQACQKAMADTTDGRKFGVEGANLHIIGKRIGAQCKDRDGAIGAAIRSQSFSHT